MNSFFSDFKSFQTSGSDAYKPGLDRMLTLDREAGCPHRRYRCIHVAGTNGKGSVSNMIAACLAASGLKVGLYTSSPAIVRRKPATWARCEIGWFGQGANGQWETSNMKRYFEDRNRKVQLVSETWPDFPPRQIDSKESNWLRYSSKFVPVPAKLKPANRLGLYDMYGNCYEMCLDCVSTNGVNRVMSEFGFRVGNLYSGMGLSHRRGRGHSGGCPPGRRASPPP